MALPSKYSIAHAVTVIGAGGHPVRPVDVNGAALDDPTQIYSIAHPVLETDAVGNVVTDATKVVSNPRKVTVDPTGTPVITVSSDGTALGAAFGGGGGSGSVSPDLTLGFPSAGNPPTVPITYVSANNQVGDVLTLQWSQSSTFASGISSGTHTLTSGDLSGGTITGFGIPTLSGIWYFRIKNNTLGQWSNVVGWGDATLPAFTSAASFNIYEGFVLAMPITTNKTLSSLVISGGIDQLQYSLVNSTLEWFSNGTQSYTTPLDSDGNNTYLVTLTATDLFGNVQTQNITGTVLSAVNPTPFTFTQAGPPLTVSTVYTSNTITIAGLASSNVTSSVSGGSYSLDGGVTWNAAGSFTVNNGSTITLQATSSSSSSGTVSVTCTVGIYTTSWVLVNASTQLNASTKATVVTLTNGGLTMKGSQFVGQNAGARATVVGQSTKCRFEVQIGTTGSGGWSSSNPMTIGVDPGTNDFTSGYLEPGHDGARPGCEIRIWPTGWTTWYGGTNTASGSDSLAVGNYIGVEFDSANNTVKFSKIISGTETTLTTVTGVSLAAWYAIGGQFQDNQSTFNFKGPWQGTISSGYVPYSPN